MDLFGIRPGESFAWAIHQAVTNAEVLVFLIGPKWLNITDENGTRRLDDPNDFVRREVTAGLDRGALVVPVLVAGATYLEASDLPDEMRGLEQLQALDLSARHWDADVALLLTRISEALDKP